MSSAFPLPTNTFVFLSHFFIFFFPPNLCHPRSIFLTNNTLFILPFFYLFSSAQSASSAFPFFIAQFVFLIPVSLYLQFIFPISGNNYPQFPNKNIAGTFSIAGGSCFHSPIDLVFIFSFTPVRSLAIHN